MSETVRPIEIGAILSTTLGGITTDIGRYGAFAGLLAVLGGLADTYTPNAGNIVSNIGFFVISVLVVHHTLRKRLADDTIEPCFGAALGYNFLTNLAIGLGLVLLIVPGLMLMARWAVGLPALLRENLGASEAMGRSSELTVGNRWRMLGLGLLIWGPLVMILLLLEGLVSAFVGKGIVAFLLLNILVNLVWGCASILSAASWTHAYLALSGEEESNLALVEIFA